MSLLNDVEALPGGRAVYALVIQIGSADPVTMSEVATGWQQAATQHAATGTTLTNVANRLAMRWIGASATAFDNYAHSLINANNSLAATLTTAAGSLENASIAIAGDRCLAATLCESLLTEVASWDVAHPGAAPTQRRAAIGSLCQETATELYQLVSSIRAELTSLSGVFAQVARQERPFDAIKPPSGFEIVFRRRLVSAPTERTAAAAPGTPPQPTAAAAPAAGGAMRAGRPMLTGGLTRRTTGITMSQLRPATPAVMARPQSPAEPTLPASSDPSSDHERN